MSYSGKIYDTAIHFIILEAIAKENKGQIERLEEIGKKVRMPESDVKKIAGDLISQGLAFELQKENKNVDDDIASAKKVAGIGISSKGTDFLATKEREMEQWWAILLKLYKGKDDEQLYLFTKSISSWLVWIMIPSGMIDKPYLEKMLKAMKMTMNKLVDYGVFGLSSELDTNTNKE